jgi:hypothetical protein
MTEDEKQRENLGSNDTPAAPTSTPHRRLHAEIKSPHAPLIPQQTGQPRLFAGPPIFRRSHRQSRLGLRVNPATSPGVTAWRAFGLLPASS